MLFNRPAPEHQCNLEPTALPGTEGKGALALEAARRSDQAWREARLEKTEGTLAFTRIASSTVSSSLNVVARGLGVVVLANGLVLAGYGLTGSDAVPDALLVMLAIGFGGLILAGALAGVCRAMHWGVTAGIRGWAVRQEIELVSGAPTAEGLSPDE